MNNFIRGEKNFKYQGKTFLLLHPICVKWNNFQVNYLAYGDLMIINNGGIAGKCDKVWIFDLLQEVFVAPFTSRTPSRNSHHTFLLLLVISYLSMSLMEENLIISEKQRKQKTLDSAPNSIMLLANDGCNGFTNKKERKSFY